MISLIDVVVPAIRKSQQSGSRSQTLQVSFQSLIGSILIFLIRKTFQRVMYAEELKVPICRTAKVSGTNKVVKD